MRRTSGGSHRAPVAVLICALLLAVALVGCGSQPAAPKAAEPAKSAPAQSAPAAPSAAQPAQPAPAATKAAAPINHPKLVIAAVSTHWTTMSPPFVALDKGYFKEFGLNPANIEIKAVGPAATHVAAFVGGSVDFSINLSTDTMMRANAVGGKVYAVAGSTNGHSYALFGAKGITSVKDLKGKAAAIDNPGGTGELLTSDILKAAGLVPGTDVKYITVAGTIPERLQAMLSGAAQAAVGSIADWPALKEQGVTVLGKASDVYPDFQFAVNGAGPKLIEQNPDALVAVLKALIRSYQFMNDPKNDAEVASILKAHEVPFDAKNWSELLALQRPYWPTKDGSPNVRGIEFVLKREQTAKRVGADYKVDNLLRLDALKRAQKELGL